MSVLPPFRIVLFAATAFVCSGQFLGAQTYRTWSSGSSSGSWATAANWSGGTGPTNGNVIVFTNDAQPIMTNDLAAGNRYVGLLMRSNATVDRTVFGNFNLFGEFSSNASKIEVQTGTNHRTLTISGNVSLGGNTNLPYEINPVGGSIIIGGSISDFGSGRILHLWGNGSENNLARSVIVSNGITGGNGLVRLRQYANLVLMGTSTYTNNTEIDTGTLMLGQGGIDGTLNTNSRIYIGRGDVNGNATLRFGKTNGGQTLAAGALLQVNAIATNGTRTIQSDNTSGTNTIERAINQNTQLFITNAAGGTLKFAGAFSTTNAPSSLVIRGGVTNAVVEFAAANNSFSNVFIDHGQARFTEDGSWGVGRIAMGMNAASTNAAAVVFTTNLTVGADFEARTNAGRKTIQYSGGAGTLTLSGAITNNATGTERGLELDVVTGGTMHASGNISGGGAVTKTGFGRLRLSGENSYTGGTVIERGIAEISGDSALGTGDVVVETDGTLAGNGKIAGNTIVHGAVAPGLSPGLLDFEKDVTFEANSLLSLEIGSTGTRGQDYDAINVGGQLTIHSTAALTLSYIDGYVPQLGDTFQFLNFSIVDGEFVFNNLIGGGLSWDTTNLYSTGEMTVIPEPSTWALLGMGVVVTFWLGRRRLRSR